MFHVFQLTAFALAVPFSISLRREAFSLHNVRKGVRIMLSNRIKPRRLHLHLKVFRERYGEHEHMFLYHKHFNESVSQEGDEILNTEILQFEALKYHTEMEADKKEKEKWYPGKYLSKSRRRSVETTSARTGSDEGEVSSRKSVMSAQYDSKDVQFSTDLNVSDNEPFVGTNADSIGTLKVNVLEVKFLRMNSAKLTIQLDRVVSQYAIDGPNKSFERGFELTEVVSDIKIMIHGRTDNGEILCGMIVIPVTSLLNFSGKPNPPKEQWRQLFPVCPSRISDGKPYKFMSGYTDLPGYALNRREPLGFVCVKVDLDLFAPPLSLYLMKGNYSWKRLASSLPWLEVDAADNVSAVTINSNAELCAMINRDMNRILSLFKLPLSLSSVLSLPEVLVINLLLGCLCFVLEAWQLPFALVSFLALNGFISMSQRSFTSVIIWNDPLPLTLVGTPADPNHSSNQVLALDPQLFLAGAVPTSVTAYPAAAAAASALILASADLAGDADGQASSPSPVGPGASAAARSNSASVDAESSASYRPTTLRLLQLQNASLGRVARTLALSAHCLEAACNVLNFADSRVSLIAYAVLSAIAAVVSLGMIFSPRTCTFLLVTVSTTVCAGSAFLLDMIGAKASNKASAGAEHMERVSNALDCLAGFLSRIPDELELTHRYIASTAVVNAKGSEMQDAAANFEKRVK